MKKIRKYIYIVLVTVVAAFFAAIANGADAPKLTDFTDNFDGNALSDKWTLCYTPTLAESETVEVKDGKFSAVATNWNTFKALKLYTGDASWSDYAVEATISVISTDPRHAGVFVRGNNIGASRYEMTGYYIAIDTDKRSYTNGSANALYENYPIQIDVYDMDGSAEKLIKTFEVDGKHFAKKTFYKLTVLAKGDTFCILLDGQYAGSFTDDTYKSGHVGINQYMAAFHLESFTVRALTDKDLENFSKKEEKPVETPTENSDTLSPRPDAEGFAKNLKALGLFKGVSDTDFALEREPSRSEALVMLIRLLGKESAAVSGGHSHPFTDVAAWAGPYVGYAYNNGLTNGVSATEFGNSNANAAAYLTFVLRALGYSDANGTDFTWDNPFELAKTVGILTADVDTESFLRADVAIVSGNALFANLKGESRTLAEKLISEGVFTKESFLAVFPGGKVAPAKAKKEYLPVSQYPDPMKISFETLEHLESNSVLYTNPQNDSEGGSYEFTGNGLKLVYSEPTASWQGQYRVMFKMETKNFLDEDHTLARITYRTNARSGEIRLYNNVSGKFTVLASDVSASGGEWVSAELAELDTDMIAALNSPAVMTLCLQTAEKDAYIEIEALDIFCSPEQAEIATAKIEPIIYKLGASSIQMQSGVRLKDESDGIKTYTNVKLDGEYALKLVYSEHSYGNYRVIIQPLSQLRADYFKQSDTWYIRVKYKTNADTYSKLAFVNNRNGDSITLESDFAGKGDGWRISSPVQLPKGFVERLESNLHATLGFSFTENNLDVYVSEIAFFTTLDDACSYYGDIDPDNVAVLSSQKTSMVMGDTGKVRVRDSDGQSETAGYWERDPDTGSVVLKYTEYNMYGWGHYRFMASFNSVPAAVYDAKYVRIVYKAKNPEDLTEPVALMLISNGKRADLIVEEDVKNTNGQWVLSPVQQMSPAVFERLSTRIHCTISFYADVPGGEYEVREMLFFNNLEEAIACKLDSEFKPINIAGNSIEKYTIVIPEAASRRTVSAAEMFKNHVFTTTGHALEVITDAEAEREHEIVIGNTSRKASEPYYGENGKYVTGELSREKYFIAVVDGDLVITAGSEIGIEEGMTEFITSFLTSGISNISGTIELMDGFNNFGSATLSEYEWSDPVPPAEPEVFTDNFEDETVTESPDYWVEAYAADNWKVQADGTNKVYGTDAKDFTYTRLHVYERDVDYTARMRFDKFSEASDAGLLVRYNDVGAYVRVGYKAGQWYLRFSEGLDFNVYTLDTAEYELKAGEWYTVRVTAQKNEVKVYINGTLLLESAYVTHISPGPMGMFAENAAVSFDDVSVTLVSGQGKVMKGVTDSTFWTEDGELCSGSVFEMADGRLRYVHHNETRQQISDDGGLTWRAEKFTDITTDCVNIFRLNSGNIIKLMVETVNGKSCHVSYTSSDEGATWTRGGIVSFHDYKGYGTVSQTIENDKFSQVSSGRIFLSQNYSGTIPSGEPNSHVQVFNEMYYSDDEGKTWNKSQMDSFDCTDIEYFAESKVIETADGALLWITSWNDTGYIIASESKDNGVTWGKFYNLTDFTCARSSFGIMRDVYADNDTTYYMVWVYNEPSTVVMPRTRLSIAMTTDGRDWKFLGDVYRWENGMRNGLNGSLINHIVDPFITVTEDHLFVGSGLSSRRAYGTNGYHNRQQQRVFRIEKSALVAYDEFPGY